MMKRWLALVVLAACAGEDTPPQDLGPVEHAIVAPLREQCVNFVSGNFLCPRLVADGKDPEPVDYPIEGFTHRWGVESEIIIRRETATSPPGNLEDVFLVDIVSETPMVIEPFTMAFRGISFGPNWFNPSDQTLGGTHLLCDGTICDEIREAELQARADEEWTVTLEIFDGQTLHPIAVSCCTPGGN